MTGRRPTSRRALNAAVLAAVVLTGCTVGTNGAPATPTSSEADPTVDLAAEAEGRTLIDVRTAEEVSQGMIEGALHLDVQDPEFEDRIAELPRDDAYLVYCRSGNRSGQAIDRMRALGFEDLINGGAYEDLAAAGLPTS